MSDLTDYIPAGHVLRLYRGRLMVNPTGSDGDRYLTRELRKDDRSWTMTSGLGLVAWRAPKGHLELASDRTMAQVQLILAAALGGT